MTKRKQILSMFLAAIMVFSIFSTAACSAGNEENPQVTPAASERSVVVETLAEKYQSGEYPGDWASFDLAVYSRWKNEEIKFLNEYESDAYKAITGEYATVSDFAKAEIILNTIGLNSTEVKSGGNEPVNNRQKLEAITEYGTYSDAIWMLFAVGHETASISSEQVKLAIDKIEQSMNNDGLLFGVYAGYEYTDIDSTGWALSALYKFANDEEDNYGEKVRATALFEKMIQALAVNQTENGSYGNTYTDASVITGLCGAGIDPTTDVRFVKNGKSLADGIMTYLNAEKNGFSSGYSEETDDWATEQAFRALLSLEIFLDGKNEPFNIYTYKVNKEETPTPEPEPENPGAEDPGQEQTPPQYIPISPEKKDTITVTFRMNTHQKTWLDTITVEIEEKSSVAKLLKKVFDENGIESKGVTTGYLRSVTYNGETWSEFDAGPGSGWCYEVNGERPRVGISSYKLSDGDFVLLKYISDYSNDDTSYSDKEEKDEEKEDKESVEEDSTKFSDIGNYSWAKEAIEELADKGIIKGMGDGKFSPEKSITRADFIVMLVRAFDQKSDNTENFDDVSENDYFAKELAIARNNGIINGIGNNKFAPRNNIKRMDMMLMAYRVLEKVGIELKKGDAEIPADISSVSDYAREAVEMLVSNGIVKGKNGKIAPDDNTTRAEIAVMISRILAYTSK